MANPEVSDDTLDAFRDALGDANVVTDEALLASQQANVTEYGPRPFVAVLRPENVEQVHAAVAAANRTGVPLHPISSGRNWGLGSRLAPAAGCALLDLGGLSRIREINRDFRYAVIEPGVTQRQLADALMAEAPDLMMHPTGSHEQTSIVGNCLERGVGYFGARLADVRGFEVVLGNGEQVRTGFWRFDTPADGRSPAHAYPPGLGPDMSGLFCQSNFGIVTGLVFNLRPRLPFWVALMEFTERDLAPVIDGLAELRTAGVISEGYEIDNEHDPRVQDLGLSDGDDVTAPGRGDRSWVVWMRLPGSEKQIDAAKHQILREIGGHCSRIEFIDPVAEDTEARGAAFHSRCGVLAGEPGNFSLEAMAGASGIDDVPPDFNPDHHPDVMGFVCALPALPYRGDAVVEALGVVDEVSASHGVVAALTLSGLSPLALEGFFRTYFDRRNAMEITEAHAWNAELHRRLSAIGIHPYRVNVQEMPAYFDDNTSGNLNTLRALKKALDPNGIIAPGRYAPSEY